MKQRKESPFNIGVIHTACAADRLQQWQANNKDTVIKKGDFCKMAFFDKENHSEWMWVKVFKVIDKDTFKGKLDSDPVLELEVKNNDTITFKREQIAEVQVPDETFNTV